MRRIKGKEYRVYGPPGTGKTTWIVGKATECADKFGEDQVSLCSLTNTAIREVAGRDLPLDSDNISTLHARCKRALAAPSPAESKVKEFIEEHPDYASVDGANPCLPPSLNRGAVDKEGEDTAETVFAGKGISLYERAQILRQQMIPKEDWPYEVRKWFSVWDSWCRESGHMDFTGWLEAALEVRPLPAQQVVFVDEAQDHTPLQLAVIRSWNAKARVLVGDDDQNLYEWSGAIPQEFFGTEIPAEREKVLEQSYRVPRAVHRVASEWANMIQNRKKKIYHPRDFEGSVQQVPYRIDNAEHEGTLPPRLLEEEGKSYMILASCSYMLNGVIEALKEQKIPFYNPYRRTNARWNPLDSPGSRILDYLAAADRPDGSWTGAEAYNWANILKARGVFKTGMKEEFLSRCEHAGGQKLPNRDIYECFLPGVLDLLAKQDLSVLKDMRKAGVPGSWNYALGIFSRPREQWKPRVIVGTIHSVKGGEADNVYLFPDLSPSGHLDYTGPNADRVMRLFYVGITRAKENLYLCQQNRPKAVKWIA